MRLAHLTVTVSAALALSACAEATQDPVAEAEPTATTAMNAPPPVAETMPGDAATPTDPQGFVNAAAASDMFEIESAKLAQQKGKSQAVKDFAAMLEREHTKSTAELKTAAQPANVTPAPEMTAKQRSDLVALEGADGNFDQLFRTQQIAAHEQALALLQAQARNGAAASLKAFAEKTAPVVEKHLAEARRLPAS